MRFRKVLMHAKGILKSSEEFPAQKSTSLPCLPPAERELRTKTDKED